VHCNATDCSEAQKPSHVAPVDWPRLVQRNAAFLASTFEKLPFFERNWFEAIPKIAIFFRVIIYEIRILILANILRR